MVWEILGLGGASLALVGGLITFMGIIFKNEFVLFGGMAIVTYWVYELAILPTWMIAILVVVMVIWIANLSKGRRR